MPNVVAVIPARYGSTRFPAKALAPICGKPMVQWTYERAMSATLIDRVIVATDDERIVQAVQAVGGEAVMTSPNHQTGTDRIAEVMNGIEADLIVNVQGDEPLVPPEVLDRLVRAMLDRPETPMGTVAVPLADDSPEATNPGVVKAVVAKDGHALYFTRPMAPFARDSRPEDAPLLHHWGIYAFRRDFLNAFVKEERSPLERCESLEQLRALEMGAKIYVLKAEEAAVGVDHPEDIAKVETLIREMGLA